MNIPKLISSKKRIYLDHASSTPLDTLVRVLMEQISKNTFGNPSALHKEGLEAKKVVEESRKSIAGVLRCHADEIIFTSGGTESNNLAILGAVQFAKSSARSDLAEKNMRPHIVTTNIEHSSVLEVCKELEKSGVEVTYVPAKENGIVDAKDVIKAIKENTILVSVMYANNEIGTIQPIQEITKGIRHWRKTQSISSPIHKVGLRGVVFPNFHIDACQAVNYLNMNTEQLGVDMISFNGSKIYGPKGVGALYKKRDVEISPIMHGGDQESGLRSGTENVVSIAGFAKAMDMVEKIKGKEITRLIKLRDYLFEKMHKEFSNVIINGDEQNRLPNNVNFSLTNISSELLVIELDAKGIAVSAKSACKSDDPDESYVLRAIRSQSIPAQAGNEEEGSLRISLGRNTQKKDVEYFIESLKKILTKYK